MATRTIATSEDRDSEIRQRCCCMRISSYAESCSAPSSRRRVEDVHSVGGYAVANCARHETCTRNQQTQHPPTEPSYSPARTTQHAKIRKQTWQHALEPPAKIATPRFGSDVAARYNRATLRAAVLQASDVTLKMSTAFKTLLPPAVQGMRLARAISKPNLRPLNHPISPFNPHNTTRKDTKTNMATRTRATSEDRDSEIRQRCNCKPCSSYAESCSAPSSRRHVEDVHSVGVAEAVRCARHETCTRNQQTQPPPTQPSHSPTRTTQHAKI
jgi:hypothetical protein